MIREPLWGLGMVACLALPAQASMVNYHYTGVHRPGL